MWAAVSPPIPFAFSKWALAGYVAGIKAFGNNIFVGVIFVVGASFWALEALWAFWVLQKVCPGCLLHSRAHTQTCMPAPCRVLRFAGHEKAQGIRACHHDRIPCRR